MIIRRFEERDLEQVKAVCLSAFSLTAFHNDPVFTYEQSSAVVWELYAKPAVTNSRNFCFVVEDASVILGFVIYGSYGELSKIVGKKMASIVLLAVKKELHNSGQKIGHTLVYNCQSFFQKNNVKLVSVGTDLNNLSALKIYTSAGFYPALFWSTWRYHSVPDVSFPEEINGQAVFALPEEAKKKAGLRLVSFLDDPYFSDDEKQKIREWYLKPRESLDLVPLEVAETRNYGKSMGFCLLEKEKAISEITGRPIFRINDLFYSNPSDIPVLVKGVLKYCASIAKTFSVEMFTRSDDWQTAKALASESFFPVHNAVTLHNRG